MPRCGSASHRDHFLQAGYEGGRGEERVAGASVWFGFWRSPVFVVVMSAIIMCFVQRDN